MKQTFTVILLLVALVGNAQMIATKQEDQLQYYAVNSSLIDFASQNEFKKRDPGVAFILSFFVSGTGQFYNGQPGKGAAMLGTSLLGVILYASGTKSEEVGGGYTTQKSAGTAFTGVALIIGSGLWSMIDAPISAGKLNKENGIALQVQPNVQLAQSNKLVFGPSISLKF